MDIETTFMDIARVWSKRSTCSARVSVGAVLVNEHLQIIASGYNGAPHGLPHCDDVGCEMEDGHCVRTIHAEENAILQCAITGMSSRGCTLYVTHSPCLRCAQRIIQAGIRRVIYGTAYKDATRVRELLETAGVEMERF